MLAYFNSVYINSVRYNQSLYSWFKLIFERNVKYKSTVSNLGNVFKNSKWSDFKTQNIKEVLIKDWVFLFTILSLIFFSYCILLGLLHTNSVVRSIPILNRLIEILTELWIPFIDYLDYLCVSIGAYYIYASLNIKSILYGYNYDLMNNTLTNQNFTKKAPIINSNTKKSLNLAPNTKSNKALLVGSASNNSKNLILTSTSSDDFNFTSKKSAALDLIKNFDTKVWFLTIKNSTLFENKSQINLNKENYTLSVPNKLLNTKTNTFEHNKIKKNIHLIPSNLNISSNLNLAKQDRWFLKNSILSDSLSSSTSSITQSKLLIGTSLLNNNSSNNIWLASKIGNLSKIEAYDFASYLEDAISNKGSLSSNLNNNKINSSQINFFENSRFFLTKRFFFLNQLENNLWSSQFQKNLKNTNYNLNSLYLYEVELYDKSLALATGGLTSVNKLDNLNLISDSSNKDLNLTLETLSILNTNNMNFTSDITTTSVKNSSNIFTTKLNSPLTKKNVNGKFIF